MRPSGALRELAAFLDDCEAAADASVGAVHMERGRLTADLELRLPHGELAARGAETAGDGLRVEMAAPGVLPERERVHVEVQELSADADGLTVSLVASLPAGGAGAGSEGREANEHERGRDRDRPPFEDPELLAAVYEDCDTFAEMVDALGMDVTPETVRRYMIDHGIHQPASYGDDEDEESDRVVLADGIGLPEGVTVDGLVDAVVEAKTPGCVGRQLGIERETAVETLQELGLLELVVGRLATENERAVGRKAVLERLRKASPT